MATKLAERFFSKTVPEPNTGCLLWTATADPDGYGQIGVGPRTIKAHRAAWTIAKGEIPEGRCVLHRCDTPACVNVEHLFLGDDGDNVRDKFAKGRDWQSGRSHCPKGHEYTVANVRLWRGHRGCLTCHRLRERNRKALARQDHAE